MRTTHPSYHLSSSAKQCISTERHGATLRTCSRLRTQRLKLLGGCDDSSCGLVSVLIKIHERCNLGLLLVEGVKSDVPFSQFKFATPNTSSWQHTGVARAPQTEAWRATRVPAFGERLATAAAEVTLRRAVRVARVNGMVNVVLVETEIVWL